MTHCPTQHRNVRPVRVALIADPLKRGESVILQWAWCPDCRAMLKRRIAIRQAEEWRRPDPGDDVPTVEAFGVWRNDGVMR